MPSNRATALLLAYVAATKLIGKATAAEHVCDFIPPIVDLAAEPATIVQQINDAAQNVGMFYVTNHGLQTLELADQVSDEFFSKLDQTDRDFYTKRGYSPVGAETLNKATQKVGDRKHGFSFKSEAPSNSTEAIINPPLTWTNYTDLSYKQVPVATYMNAVMHETTSLGLRLAEYLCQGMNLDKDCFTDFLANPLRYIRILEYPATPSHPEQGSFGAGSHTDYGLITILYIQRGTAGLQILNKQGEWNDVPAIDNCLIVNVGEMMWRFSHRKYMPVVHQVVKDDSTESRRSLVLFLNGDRKKLVYPLIPAAGPGSAIVNTTFENFLAEKNKLAFPNGTPNQNQLKS